MISICSAHQDMKPGCPACMSTMANPSPEPKMVMLSQATLIQLVACALEYDTKLPHSAVPQEVIPLLPDGWIEKYWEGRS